MLVCHWTAVLFWSSHCRSSAQLSRAVLSVHLSWGTQWTPKLMLSGDVPRMTSNQGEDIAEFPLQFCVFALRMPIAGKNTSVWWQYIIQWDLLFFFKFLFLTVSQSCRGWQGLLETIQSKPRQPTACCSGLHQALSISKDRDPTTSMLLPPLFYSLCVRTDHGQVVLESQPVLLDPSSIFFYFYFFLKSNSEYSPALCNFSELRSLSELYESYTQISHW